MSPFFIEFFELFDVARPISTDTIFIYLSES